MQQRANTTIAVALVGAIAALAAISCGPDAATKQLMEQAKGIFGTIPATMPGAEKDTPALVALGSRLYNEKGLSVNDSQSCASCHILEKESAGVDNQRVSKGALPGREGNRNSPTVLNAGFHVAQFWDGRAKDLKEQAKGPILNPAEMAMPGEAAVIKKLKGMAAYPDAFRKAFPGVADPVTYDNLAGAIAAFERTLRTTDRFDDFQNGKADALSSAEKDGLRAFIGAGCTACHTGPMLGGHMYQKMGSVRPYRNTTDRGRFDLTKKPEDMYMFKVPSLRNVALTAPYFHDGAAKTLEEAVTMMGSLQLGKDMKPGEVRSIVAFLKALSDRSRAK